MSPTDEPQKNTRKPRRANNVVSSARNQGKTPLSRMLTESGVSGTKNFAGVITDEYLPALSAYQAPLVYDRMRRSDATVAALVAAYVMPLRSSKWYIQPYDDSPDALRVADFLHDNLWGFGEQTFDDFAREAFTYLPFGFSVHEKVFDWMDTPQWEGKIGWTKFAFRYQNTRFRWNFEPVKTAGGGIHRRFTSMTQLAPPDYRMTDIDAERLVVFSHNKEGDNLDGISILRAAYKHWLIKDILYKIQGIGLERAAVGVPFARYLMDVPDDTLAYITRMLENLRTDDQASIQFDGNEVDIGYLANKFDAVAVATAIDHHDGQILKSALAQFVNLGTRSYGTTGSYALSTEQSQMFLDCLNGEANYFASAFHLQATIQLLDYNFPRLDRSTMPRLAHGDIGERARDKLAMAVNAFGQYGFLTPDPRTENVIRSLLDFPERDEDYHLQQALDTLETTNTPAVDTKLTTKKTAPASDANDQGGDSGQSSGGTGSQVRRNIAPRPKTRMKSVGGAAVGSNSVSNMSERELARLQDDFLGEVENMKRSAISWRPERPSEKAARLRRPYEIRG